MSRIGELKATLRRRTTSLASWELPKEESTIAPPEVYTNKGEAAIGSADLGDRTDEKTWTLQRPNSDSGQTGLSSLVSMHKHAE